MRLTSKLCHCQNYGKLSYNCSNCQNCDRDKGFKIVSNNYDMRIMIHNLS